MVTTVCYKRHQKDSDDPFLLRPHGLIQFFDGLPQLLPLAARPGIASCCRLTLWTFWPAGLLPRLPPLDGFALLLPLLCCPGACRHAVLPLIVRFVGAGFALRAWIDPMPRRC